MEVCCAKWKTNKAGRMGKPGVFSGSSSGAMKATACLPLSLSSTYGGRTLGLRTRIRIGSFPLGICQCNMIVHQTNTRRRLGRSLQLDGNQFSVLSESDRKVAQDVLSQACELSRPSKLS